MIYVVDGGVVVPTWFHARACDAGSKAFHLDYIFLPLGVLRWIALNHYDIVVVILAG